VALNLNKAVLRSQYHYYRQWYAQRYREWRSPVRATPVLEQNFVFMHIPKAGGSSTRHFFKSLFPARLMYPEPRLARFPEYAAVATGRPRVYMGHLGFHFAEEARATKACLLRHPAERLLSLYSYSVNPGRNRPLIGGLPAGMGLLEFLRSNMPGIRMNADNGQTWQIGYGYSAMQRRQFMATGGGDILAAARGNLHEIDHLGVIEKFDQFKQRLLDTYGGSYAGVSVRKNVAVQRLNYSDLTMEEKRVLDACIELDAELYDAVLKRL